MAPQYDLGLFQGLTASRINIQGGAMAPPCPPLPTPMSVTFTRMDRLKRNASTLKLLCGAKKPFQKVVLEKSKDDLIKCICDISFNVLKGSATISKQNKKRLSCHKSSLSKLIDRKLSLKKKRKVIQSGGFLLALSATAIPILGSLFGLAK